jgi:hypothetical protein
VAQQPRVDSTIMGARTLLQLEDNIGSTDITLSEAELDCLGELTKPEFGFPQNAEPHFPSVHHAGASVNGVSADTSPYMEDFLAFYSRWLSLRRERSRCQ